MFASRNIKKEAYILSALVDIVKFTMARYSVEGRYHFLVGADRHLIPIPEALLFGANSREQHASRVRLLDKATAVCVSRVSVNAALICEPSHSYSYVNKHAHLRLVLAAAWAPAGAMVLEVGVEPTCPVKGAGF